MSRRTGPSVSRSETEVQAPQCAGVDVTTWERRTDVPMTLLALAFLVAYAWPILQTALSPSLMMFCQTVSWCVWGAFALDLVVRLVLAERRWEYAKSNWYDVALVVLPMLRPLRLLRVLALARFFDRSVAANLVGRMAIYVAGTALMALGLGALAVLDAERTAPGATITNFGDALWWSAATVTTVGYGDFYPVTLEGRLVALVLMVVGIGVVGTVTASIASWFVSRVGAPAAGANVVKSSPQEDETDAT